MSTQITTYGDAVIASSSKRPSVFRRAWDSLVAAGEAQGQRRVVNYLASLSDHRLGQLGYSKAQIHEIRVLRTLPTPSEL